MSGPASELINIDISQVVRAGAGAGKTTDLSKNVLKVAEQFLERDKRFPNVVVTTFTRKATEELTERIRSFAIQSKKMKLIEFSTSPSLLHVSTLHGVCSLFLRRYGQRAGIDPSFLVTDGPSDLKRTKRLVKLLHDEDSGKSLIWELLGFNGAFEVLQEYQKARGYSSKSRYGNIEEIIAARDRALQENISTVHRTIEHIIRFSKNNKWLEYASKMNSFKNLSLNEWNQEILNAFKAKPQFRDEPFDPSVKEEFFKALEGIDKIFSSPNYNLENFTLFTKVAQDIERFGNKLYQLSKAEKIKSGQLTSDDLETFTLELLRTYPELAKVYSSDWDYWFFDEYQDTSPAQAEILKYFSQGAPTYTVGDPQQSIYLFRNAEVKLFSDREEEINKLGGLVTKKLINYRSQANLLDCINDFLPTLGHDFLPMQAYQKTQKDNTTVLQYAVDPDDSPYASIIEYIKMRVQSGESYQSFVVLVRTNEILEQVSHALESAQIPTEVHSSSGFYRRREVLDILQIIKFLLNPHDDLNLICVIRSPWFRICDNEIFQMTVESSKKMWVRLKEIKSDHLSVQKLQYYLSESNRVGILQTLLQILRDTGIVDASHHHDSTGRRESNIWKLVTQLQSEERKPGFSYTQFLRDAERAYDDGGEETDAVAALEPNRVAIMTIHKSKGLTFKNVIIPRMEQVPKTPASNAHKSPLIWNELKSVWTPRVPLPPEDTNSHSPLAYEFLSQKSKKESEEYRRLFYVAITRASESLFFHWIDKNLSNDSWAGMIKSALPFDKNHKKTYKVEKFEATKSLQPVSQNASKRSVTPNRYLYDQSPQVERISVTALIAEKHIEATKDVTLEKVDISALKAPVTGTVIHRAFEALHYNKEIPLSQMLENKAHIEAIENILNLKSPPLKQIIESGQVEWGFQFHSKLGIIEGQIDLWGTINDITWVIDYKTGSDRYVNKALTQLQLYAFFLSKYIQPKKMKLAVVFPLTGKVIEQDFVIDNRIAKEFDL